MSDLSEHILVNLMVFKNDDEVADETLVGEICDTAERFEVAFNWGGKRYYIAMRPDEVRAALTVTGAP